MNITELANESGLTYYGMGKDRARFIYHLEYFANLVAAQEREECAKVIELHAGIIDTPNAFNKGPSNFAKMIARDLADSIRDRGTT